MPATANGIIGRRPPRFKVSFYAVATVGAKAAPLAQIGGPDFNSDILSLQATTATNAGFQQLNVIYDALLQLPGGRQPEGFARLVRRPEMRGFIHVVVTEGADVVWEGRISKLYEPGGRINRFDAIGYGNFATKDYPLQWVDNTSTLTSGQLLARAVRTASPTVTPGVDGTQFIDPGIPHTPADLANTKYLSEVIDQVTKEGNGLGQTVYYAVWENRTLSLLPLVLPSGGPTYEINWSQAVDYQEDVENMYGALVLTYSGGLNSPLMWPAGGQNVAWVNENGFSMNGDGKTPRTAHINGGALTDARALAFAQTQLGVISQPVITSKATVQGSMDAPIPGMRLYRGGTRAPWLVRAGEWVQIGADDQGMTVSVPIVRTTLKADQKSVSLVAELGQLSPTSIDTTLMQLRTSARYQALGTSPLTGAPR